MLLKLFNRKVSRNNFRIKIFSYPIRKISETQTFLFRHRNGDGLKSVKNNLKKTMKITESDFWLLVATGERLKPGFSRMFVNYRIV